MPTRAPLRPRHLLALALTSLAGCKVIATILLLPFVAFAWICAGFSSAEGLTNQDELRAGGIRIESHVVEFRLEDDLTYSGTIETVRTVTGPAGLADAQQASYTFDPRSEELVLEEADVVNPDGSRHAVSDEQVFTRPSAAAQGSPGFVSTVTRTVLFPQLRVGSRTHVKWSFKQNARSQVGFNYDWRPAFTLPIGEARIRITCPADAPLRVAVRGGLLLSDDREGGERVIEASLRDFAGRTPEKAMVAPDDLLPLFVASSFDSWEAVGASFHEAVSGGVEVTPEIEARAAQIAGTLEGLDAARAIHRWVAGNIQYVAVYLSQSAGWVPHRASEVLAAGYGDCKDQYVLLASLLEARGIRAEPVLVGFDRAFELYPIASPLQFDHCMAWLPDYDLYSNPIDPYRDLGELDLLVSGKFVVVGSREGGTARTPEGSADLNRYRVEQQVVISADGRLSGTSTLDFAGRPAGRARRALALAGSTEQLADDLLSGNPAGGSGELRCTDPSDLSVPLRCEGEWSGDVPLAMGTTIHLSTPVGLDRVNSELLLQFVSAAERRTPALVPAVDISWKQTLQAPPGYVFVPPPAGRELRNDAGRFESAYSLGEDGRLTVERRLRLEHDRYPPELYAALREILQVALTDMAAILTAEQSG
jgi:transglutaminase-like putative cysteine protease